MMLSINRFHRYTPAYITASAILALLPGCSGSPVEPLMPTPLIYQQSERSPIDHVPDAERWTLRRVFYATTRERESDIRKIVYGNEESPTMSMGISLIGFGDYETTWSDLRNASITGNRFEVVPLSIAGLMEVGRIDVEDEDGSAQLKGASLMLIHEIRNAVEEARDKDIMIYVHGAKVDFYNACAFAAQLDHFMGRDMTSIAFSWPTRQNILAYAFGDDVERGLRSAPALALLIRMLAENTGARRINIVTWSAGGRVVTEALTQLYDHLPDKSSDRIREQLRIGTVYFAASDVPRDEFLEALPKINSSVHRVVVTGSSNDSALKQAALFMGGSTRIGQIASTSVTPEQLNVALAADRLEYVDVSRGSDDRGFDITGHRYWLDHPWASSDMVLTIRTDLSPEERGLEPGSHPVQWLLPADYPERLRAIVNDPNVVARESGTERQQ